MIDMLPMMQEQHRPHQHLVHMIIEEITEQDPLLDATRLAALILVLLIHAQMVIIAKLCDRCCLLSCCFRSAGAALLLFGQAECWAVNILSRLVYSALFRNFYNSVCKSLFSPVIVQCFWAVCRITVSMHNMYYY